MTEDVQRHRVERPKSELLVEFLRERFLSVALLVGLVVVGYVALGADVGLPRGVWVFLLSFVFFVPLGYLTGSKAKALLFDSQWVWLLDLDALESDAALFRIPLQQWPDLEVEKDELNQVAPRLYFGKEVDIDEMSAKGTWRGTLSDREMLIALGKIAECRGQLEDDARRGWVLRSHFWIIVRRSVQDATLHLVRTFQKGTLPDDGEAIGNAVDRAIKDTGFDDLVDHLDDIDRVDLDDLEELIDDQGPGDVQQNGSDPLADIDHAMIGGENRG